MAALTGKITFYVILGVYLMALIQNLGILPSISNITMPAVDSAKAFNEVSEPQIYSNDAMLGLSGLAMIIPAVKALLGSIVNVFYIMPIITNWGLDLAYAVFAQSILLLFYGYDAFLLWTGREII